MTIDDFDVNEISDKLAIREETDNAQTLQAAHDDFAGHDDGHNDLIACGHDDAYSPPSHWDHGCGHDDGHYDLQNHDDTDPCPGYRECPS